MPPPLRGRDALFGAYKQTAGISGILTVPEAAWELSLGNLLIVKGFKASSPLISTGQTGGRQAGPASRQ